MLIIENLENTYKYKEESTSPGWMAQLVGELSCTPKSFGFNPWFEALMGGR